MAEQKRMTRREARRAVDQMLADYRDTPIGNLGINIEDSLAAIKAGDLEAAKKAMGSGPGGAL